MALKALTIAQIRDAVRLTSTAADTRLTLLGESVEDFLSEYLGIQLEPTNITSERVLGGGRWLRPLYAPLTAVSALEIVLPTDIADPEIAATEYEIHTDGLLSKHESSLWLYYEYSISYTAGYADADAVPSRFKQIALEMLARAYFNSSGKQSQSSKAGSVAWATMLTPEQEHYLGSISNKRVF